MTLGSMRFCWTILLGLWPSAQLLADEPTPPTVATEQKAGKQAPLKVSYDRQVRPILSDRCFMCHGPDENTREADLRLDTREGATADRDGSAAVVPGNTSASALLARVTSSDPDLKMPPASSNKKPLSEEEIATLKTWIAEGAGYESHWSLRPMARPQPPALTPERAQQAANEIDHFVLQQIAEHKLGSFAPPAPRGRWLRRVTLDLTGLPPTIAELEAFEHDDSPQAYERVVDRLLQSPRYGERMAADWLDVARFADTHGYQADRFRPMWAYRDWVIKSFQQNQPFDEFVRWQIAGDLLPNATKDQHLATAFQRLHCQNEEGGIVEEEFRVAYVNDRVTTFGTAFLGLTLECTRCHDHKYDAVTMRDYYSLFAFFQNIPECGQTTYWTHSMPTPTMLLSTPAQDDELAQKSKLVEEKLSALGAVREGARGEFESWLGQRPAEVTIPGELARFDFEALQENKMKSRLEPPKEANAVEGPELVPGPSGNAARLNGENGFTFPGLGRFTRAEPFSLSIRLLQPTPSSRAVVVHHSKAPVDAGHRGYDLLLEEGRVAFGLYHMWPGDAVKIRTRDPIAPAEWTHVVVTHDGSGKAAGMNIYVDGVAVPTDVITDRLKMDIIYEDGEPDLAIGYRFRDNGFKEGQVDDFSVFDRELTPIEAAHLAGRDDLTRALTAPADSLSAGAQQSLFDFYTATVHPASLQALAEVKQAREAWRDLLVSVPEAMVMEELAAPKPAFVLTRGNYDQPAAEVSADTPASLPPFPKDAPRNRLGLADWLLDPEHPLMARVTVNRFWQMFFGRGIVETADNFGAQGSVPTHPELLDWLARDFIDHDWDVHRLVKQIVLSAAYRQESKGTSEAREIDPDNLWLSHAPVRRLSAEMLRDQALFVSGLLTEQIGGPSVKPYQPDGLWNIAMINANYDQSHGPDLYRRSIYTYWKRTVPPPSMLTFDAADRSYCTVRRQSTSTPLQALVLLNDPQHVEAARQAGARMLRDGGSAIDDQVAWLFRFLTGRVPSERERAIFVAIFAEQRDLYAADEAAAKSLLTVGESPADPNASAVDLAAAAIVAQAIMNHDEAVHRR